MPFQMIKSSQKTHFVFLSGWGFHASIGKYIIPGNSHQRMHYLNIDNTTFYKNTFELIHTLNKQLPENTIIIAWSLGGLLAAQLCYYFPKKYKQLILIASTPRFSSAPDWPGINNETLMRFKQLAQKNSPHFLKKFSSLVQHPNANANIHSLLLKHNLKTHNKILRFHLDILIQADLRSLFSKLQLPVLQIFGLHDAILSRAMIHKISLDYRHFETIMLPEAGHALFLTHPKLFHYHLGKFIGTSLCV